MAYQKIKALLADLYIKRAATKAMLANFKDNLSDEIANSLLDKLIDLNKAIDILERQLKNKANG